MGLVGGALAARILRRYGGDNGMNGSAYAGKSKLEALMGPDVWQQVQGKVVLDFGCGCGHEAVEMAQHGATRVIGVDILEPALEQARRFARTSGEHERCAFTTSPSTQADVIVSLDSFEHFGDPTAILQTMHRYLAPGGSVLVSFGPTWYHPLGGHLFAVFPWAHLIFTEASLIRWRSQFKADGATRFSEVAGGLNQMTIGRFLKLVAQSPLRVAELELRPIRRLAPLHNRLTREFTTATVKARLVAA